MVVVFDKRSPQLVAKARTVNPRISPGGLFAKMNFWVGAYSRGGGLISKFSIFLNGRHKNDIIFLTNVTKN